jgi:hypothetical protein
MEQRLKTSGTKPLDLALRTIQVCQRRPALRSVTVMQQQQQAQPRTPTASRCTQTSIAASTIRSRAWCDCSKRGCDRAGAGSGRGANRPASDCCTQCSRTRRRWLPNHCARCSSTLASKHNGIRRRQRRKLPARFLTPSLERTMLQRTTIFCDAT